jgi:DNA processing protein
MAIGIDREAHLGALEEGGSTVGVMANGIDVVYPAANRDLYRQIESSTGSALISEYPPGIRAGKWTFVRRNRIISGLCAGTVVIKAGEKSGALITARYALEQGREVFVCSGNSFDDEYAGCHRLIQDGAMLVSNMGDILDELARVPGTPGKVKRRGEGGMTHDEARCEDDQQQALQQFGPTGDTILNLVRGDDYHVDTIIREMGRPPSEIHEAIIELELAGMILRNGNTITRA